MLSGFKESEAALRTKKQRSYGKRFGSVMEDIKTSRTTCKEVDCSLLQQPVKGCNNNNNVVTPELIRSVQTKRGGWTKRDLARMGVPWPPPRGWRKELEALYHAGTPRRLLEPSEGQQWLHIVPVW
jgi:hypothetical protein